MKSSIPFGPGVGGGGGGGGRYKEKHRERERTRKPDDRGELVILFSSDAVIVMSVLLISFQTTGLHCASHQSKITPLLTHVLNLSSTRQQDHALVEGLDLM